MSKIISGRNGRAPGQTEPGSRHAISEQCILRRVDAPPTNGSGNMGILRQARGQPLHLKRQHSLPNVFLEGQGRVGPRLVQPSPSCFSPYCPDPAGNQAKQSSVSAPLWRNQHWFAELSWLFTAAPWPIPLRRDLLSQANGTIWHPQPELWALHLWPLDGSLRTFSRVC